MSQSKVESVATYTGLTEDQTRRFVGCLLQVGLEIVESGMLAKLKADNKALLDALKDLRSRYIGLFEHYVRKTYAPNSNPDSDLEVSLVDTDAALAEHSEPQ